MPARHNKNWAFITGLPASIGAGAVLGAQEGAARGASLDGGQLLQVVLSLIAVLAIIVGLFALIRRLNMLPGSSNGVIRVIGGVSLGAKERLVLIQVGEEQILVSASQGSVNKIHKLEKSIEAADIAGPRKGFSDVFRSVMDGRKS